MGYSPEIMEIKIKDWHDRHPEWKHIQCRLNVPEMGFDVFMVSDSKRVDFFLPNDVEDYEFYFNVMINKGAAPIPVATENTVKKEMVNHPNHYNKEGRKECWDEMIDVFGPEAVLIFDLLSAFKYDYRKGDKDGNPVEQELRKIEAYEKHSDYLAERYSNQINHSSLVCRVLNAYADHIENES